MFLEEEISEISAIIEGIIDHVETYYNCDDVGPSMSYEHDQHSFDIDYTCWGSVESMSSITSISTIEIDDKKQFLLNIIETGYSNINGDYQYEESFIFSNIDELSKKMFELFGF